MVLLRISLDAVRAAALGARCLCDLAIENARPSSIVVCQKRAQATTGIWVDIVTMSCGKWCLAKLIGFSIATPKAKQRDERPVANDRTAEELQHQCVELQSRNSGTRKTISHDASRGSNQPPG